MLFVWDLDGGGKEKKERSEICSNRVQKQEVHVTTGNASVEAMSGIVNVER